MLQSWFKSKTHVKRLKTSSFTSQNLNKSFMVKDINLNCQINIFQLLNNQNKLRKRAREKGISKKVLSYPWQKDISQPLTYNRFFSNINKVIRKKVELTSSKESLKEIFNYQPATAFKRNKNLQELIGRNKLQTNKVKKRQIQKLKTDKRSPFLINSRSFCCKKKRKTTTFKSQQTQKIYMMFHQVNCSRRSLRNDMLLC